MRLPFRVLLVAMAATALVTPAHAQPATVDDARAFMARAESTLADLSIDWNRAGWVAATYITHDTEALSAEAQRKFAVAVQQFATEATRFEKITLPPELARKFTLLKLALAAPPPADSRKAELLTRISVGLESDYGRGSWCRPPSPPGAERECLQINELSRIMAQNRDPDELRDVWVGWRTIAPAMRDRYVQFVELSNEGARGLGFADAGAMWRSSYDMPPDDFAREVDRLWEQVEPLYVALHAYVRARLSEKYGPRLVPRDGLIPAHLLGNMWAQEWGNIYEVVAPGTATTGYDLTKLLEEKKVDQTAMVRFGEGFFTSLGFDSLPPTFWERSMIVKPRDREVVCHASAWDIDNEDDIRIKMCTEVNATDFVTVHHELGHNFYQRAYKAQPFLFKNGANDGFHEAIGDAIALSITPKYLEQVGLLDRIPPANDTLLLLRQALDKVAFLPFGLLIDQWRWKVFSGEVPPARYNAAWWELRTRYQGIAPPVARSEEDFDPGAKFHVPANTPYTRYFLARILQFQFYQVLCREAGHTGPLHQCSFYGSKEAGAKLNAMLELGASKPWPEALEQLTGTREIDATALVDYFAPLKVWLDRQNRGKPVGWKEDSGTGGR
ncbi:MAG TPA: M2 family metallopeptidase [Gemmatimonadaceae bacterium]|nr:M2 family metallopeptidase [Gemmatimonadaceae bacterium]